MIGKEAREQMLSRIGRLPDLLIAAIGGGSNAIGLFHPFLDDPDVKMLGVEAAGHGLDKLHAASLAGGAPGVLHGNKTYLLQDDDGQIDEAHSISAGLDYPGIGPEHAWLRDIGRVVYDSATDVEALDAFQLLCRTEGIIPALEPSHAIAAVTRKARENAARPDHPRQPLRPWRQGHLHRRRGTGRGDLSRFATAFTKGRPALVAFVTAGDPTVAATPAILDALVEGGADVIELGMPFTDPMADGPAIQAANLRSLGGGTTTADILALARGFRERHPDTPLVLMGYANPMLRRGPDWFASECAKVGVDGVICVDLPPEEDDALGPALRGAGVDPIRLATPTTDAVRLPAVLEGASGFVYYVSVAGITGKQQATNSSIASAVAAIKARTPLPVAVGFGIRTPEQAAAVAAHADGVVIGSAIVEIVAAHGGDAAGPVSRLYSRHIRRHQEARMSWISSVRNALSFVVPKKDSPDNLWHKCKGCGQMVFAKELEDNLWVCPTCEHHERIGPVTRFEQILDPGFTIVPMPKVPEDPLKFRDSKRYTDRIKAARAQTGEGDALVTARGTIDGRAAVVGVQDFAFMGGSMGLAVGEAFVRGVENAIERNCPYVHLHRLGRCAHAGRHPQPDADAAQHRRDPDAPRCRPALHRRADRSDLGWGDGGLCDARRCAARRTRRNARLHRPPRDREHDPREAARGFPDVGISARPRHARHDRPSEGPARHARAADRLYVREAGGLTFPGPHHAR